MSDVIVKPGRSVTAVFGVIGRTFELSDRQPLLHEKQLAVRVVILLTLGVALSLAAVQYFAGRYDSSISLLILLAVGTPAFFLNERGKVGLASLLTLTCVIGIVQYNLNDGGIIDPAMLALPIIIIYSGLIYGSRSVIFFTVVAITSVAIAGFVDPVEGNTISDQMTDIVLVSTLLLATGSIVYYVLARLERHIERVKETEREIRAAWEGTLRGLASALELRDRETEGHSQRVIDLSEQLARAVGISDPEELQQLRYGAMLHDIGKIAIPDGILLKEGPLTDGEWQQMRMHVEYGRNFVGSIAYLRRAMDVVAYHHERWDGNGYPKGLAGEAIPRLARIFSVVDAWDALNSDRPYRDRWSREEVMRYMELNAGIMFDPNVVRVFLAMIEQE